MKTRADRIGREAAKAFALAAVLVAAAPVAHAQTIERNLPPGPGLGSAAITPPNATPDSQDATPIGPALVGMVFLGKNDAALRGPGTAGIDAGRVKSLDDWRFDVLMELYLGQRISKRLIAEIQQTIAEFYRDQGYPFVAVSTPPQEISGGVLQFRIVEFSLGNVAVQGTKRAPESYIRSRVRVVPGQPVDSRRLSEDLEWLSRNPSRNVEAVFSPGRNLGVSDLSLRATEGRQLTAFAGYANSGSRSTGENRYILGASVYDLGLPDLSVSYQFTSSDDFWVANGQAFGNAGNPSYGSHAGFVSIPTAPRQAIEATGSFITTHETPNVDFDVEKRTLEGSIGYRTAVSNFGPVLGDVMIGVEARTQQRRVLFANTPVLDLSQDIFQIYAGAIGRRQFDRNIVTWDARLHGSPGNLWSGNSDAALSAYSAGRVDSATYVYANGTVGVERRLTSRASIKGEIKGQTTTGPLPETEQFGLGGVNAVRGYSSEDGSYDTGVLVRTEVRPLTLTVATGRMTLQPFVFADAGAAGDWDWRNGVGAASTGAGVDVTISSWLSANSTVGVALVDMPSTQVGDVRADIRVFGRY